MQRKVQDQYMHEAICKTLSNGIRLVVLPQPGACAIALQAWLQVGSADEPEGLYGIAHVHEHMLFKGTAKRASGQVGREVAQYGGSINAWTSLDETVLHVVLPQGFHALAIEILADTLLQPSFYEEQLQREKQVILQEMYQAEDNQGRRLAHALFAHSFAPHPYGRPILGDKTTVSELDRQKLITFHQQYCGADRLVLVCVGDLKVQEIESLVETHFAGYQPSTVALTTPRPLWQFAQKKPAESLIGRDGLMQLACAWPGCALKDFQAAVWDVLALLLSEGDAAYLVSSLKNSGLVQHLDAANYAAKEAGLFTIGMHFKSDHYTEVCQALWRSLYRLQDLGPSSAELARVKVPLLSQAAYQAETVQGQARALGYYTTLTNDAHYQRSYERNLKKVHAKHIRDAAKLLTEKLPTMVLQAPEAERIAAEQLLGDMQRYKGSLKIKKVRFQLPRAGKLDVHRYVFNNGAVLLYRREKAPIMAVRAVALGGQRYETPQTAGISQLFAASWGRTSRHEDTVSLANKVSHYGGSLGAFAGRNTLGLAGDFMPEHADGALDLFLEVLKFKSVPAELHHQEQENLLDRIKSRQEHPAWLASEALAEILYPGHPYSLPILGDSKSLRASGMTDLAHLANLFLSPDKLILSVVGDIEPQVVYRHCLKFFEDTSASPLPQAPNWPSNKDLPAVKHMPLKRAQAHLMWGGPGPHFRDKQRFAMELLCAVMSGQSGRLFDELRDKQALAYSLSMQHTEGLDCGGWTIHIGCDPRKLAAVKDCLQWQLQKLCQQGIHEEDLHRIQQKMLGQNAIQMQRVGSRAMRMALMERYGLGYDAELSYVSDMMSVTRQDIQQVAEQFLQKETMKEVIVGNI